MARRAAWAGPLRRLEKARDVAVLRGVEGLDLRQRHHPGTEGGRVVALRLGQDRLAQRAVEALRHGQQRVLVLHRQLAVLGVEAVEGDAHEHVEELVDLEDLQAGVDGDRICLLVSYPG